MELELIKKVKVNPKTLFVLIPDYENRVFHDLTWYDEPVKFEGVEYKTVESIEQTYPELFNTNSQDEKCLVLTIDIETGQVINWPKNSPFDFYDRKIIDTGEYILLDNKGETIAHYSGYVPQCVGEGGYGDYLEFEIDSASNIPYWSFNQEDFNEFMKESGDELYENF